MTETPNKKIYIGWAVFSLTLIGLLVSISIQFASMRTLLDIVRADQLIVQEQHREGCK